MGKVAGELSDIVVVTSDNPRTEDPEFIIDEIEPGLNMTGRSYLREVDRRTAIARALSLAQPGDAVLIAGKGHEPYQIIGHAKSHFDDRETAREILRSMGEEL
jgi:UDP-N-acetylmuramoyl-L-alanyl-D-glutamate--2,6-diaminopimelate ligase